MGSKDAGDPERQVPDRASESSFRGGQRPVASLIRTIRGLGKGIAVKHQSPLQLCLHVRNLVSHRLNQLKGDVCGWEVVP